ncbi:hypothetical protein BU26DRAFT_143854 [Trematosphaeria pertusa]|uniref:Uncharacterized protein n=1 Tax=Trematosphaeria pertusa TaxID=390896 RepID=A0A6A6IXF4_9PLEO|nr:uncharacterized protein BU26DRAFT_143854 [Trematosphaeria pertusa]KAF2254707.1 hypothetical protein BU26DRAFT_143854 [Trematosphaeria pertusa]
MPTRFNNNKGLALQILKLNGQLGIHFTSNDNSPAADYTFQDSELEDTGEMKAARQIAFGLSLRSQGLELYLEEANGIVDLKFEGASGGLLSVEHDGRAYEQGLEAVQTGVDYMGFARVKQEPKTTPAAGITEPSDDPSPAGTLEVFTSFNEPATASTSNESKEVACPGAPYHAYKHIYLEGYRTGPGSDYNEEGRLHIDLSRHKLIWESCDEYEGGTRITLECFDLPACAVENLPLKNAHFFGDHSLKLCYGDGRAEVAFAMDYCEKECKVFGNNVGTGNARFYFTAEDKIQVVLDAVQECLEVKSEEASCQMVSSK